MRLLIDNNLSWRLGRALRDAGLDAVHVGTLGVDESPDPVIMDLALREDRIIITRDSDFESLIAASGRSKPSVVHLRTRDGQPRAEAAMLITHLPALGPDLATGSIVTIDDTAVRVLRLG